MNNEEASLALLVLSLVLNVKLRETKRTKLSWSSSKITFRVAPRFFLNAISFSNISWLISLSCRRKDADILTMLQIYSLSTLPPAPLKTSWLIVMIIRPPDPWINDDDPKGRKESRGFHEENSILISPRYRSAKSRTIIQHHEIPLWESRHHQAPLLTPLPIRTFVDTLLNMTYKLPGITHFSNIESKLIAPPRAWTDDDDVKGENTSQNFGLRRNDINVLSIVLLLPESKSL